MTVVLEPAVVKLAGNRLDIPTEVGFKTDSHEIDDGSVLDEVASFLLAHPEITLLRVEGHADEPGTTGFNYDLSKRRAEAAVDALVERGIARVRLQAIGTGEAKEARRAVEFIVLVRSDE